MNQNDLLIFRARAEEKKGKEKAVQKKPQPVAPAGKKVEQPVVQPKPQPQVQAPQPVPMMQYPTTERPQEKIVAQAAAQKQPEAKPQVQVPAQEKEVIVAAQPEEAVEQPLPFYETPVMETQRQNAVRTRSAKDLRSAAEGLSCEIHPWRKAYALCSYCKRPFCYEDIVEHGGTYYCLDDIEKIPQTEVRTAKTAYNKFSMVASVAFFVVFVSIAYYNYAGLVNILGLLRFFGIAGFLSQVNIAQAEIIGGFVLAVLAIVSTILLLMETKHSFRLAVSVGILIMGVYSYRFVSLPGALENAFVAGFAFLSLIALAYSRNSYEGYEEEQPVVGRSPQQSLSSPGF